MEPDRCHKSSFKGIFSRLFNKREAWVGPDRLAPLPVWADPLPLLWDFVLKPHRRATDQPKTKIDVVYGPAEGRTATAQQVARSIRLLETVAEHAADDFVWPALMQAAMPMRDRAGE
jgi:hypothetical protein